MNPQQDYLGPNNNPYDFIMNPSKPPKKASFGLDPFIGKILLVLGVVFSIMVVVAIFLSATDSKKLGTAELIALAQTQQEIIRVANQGTSAAVQQTTKNLAITTEFSLKTQQSVLLDYLAKKKGTEVSEKELALKQDAKTDLLLKEAKQTSTYDITLSQILEESLRNYSNSANSLFKLTTNEAEQTLLSNNYSQTQLLISQVPYTRDAIEEADQ